MNLTAKIPFARTMLCVQITTLRYFTTKKQVRKIVTILTCFQRNRCRKNIVKKWHEVLFGTYALLVNSLLKCRHKTISVFSITKNEFGKAGRVWPLDDDLRFDRMPRHKSSSKPGENHFVKALVIILIVKFLLIFQRFLRIKQRLVCFQYFSRGR